MSYLPTEPGTQMAWTVKSRKRPCWRCRLFLRWPPWRKHWQCRKISPITNYVGGRHDAG